MHKYRVVPKVSHYHMARFVHVIAILALMRPVSITSNTASIANVISMRIKITLVPRWFGGERKMMAVRGLDPQEAASLQFLLVLNGEKAYCHAPYSYFIILHILDHPSYLCALQCCT